VSYIPRSAVNARTPAEEREQEAERERRARLALTARSMRRRAEEAREFELNQLRQEQEAKRALDEHVHTLAREIDRARDREVNVWLSPGDAGYVSPTERAVRRQIEADTQAIRPQSAESRRAAQIRSLLPASARQSPVRTTYYTVGRDETPKSIARTVLGDEALWRQVALAAGVTYWDQRLPAGKTLSLHRS
jgi:nucleoid-associated protein YgaU